MSSQSHIVLFKSDATQKDIDAAAEKVEQHGGTITNRYSSSVKGFSFQGPEAGVSALKELKDDSKIELIEQDKQVKTQ